MLSNLRLICGIVARPYWQNLPLPVLLVVATALFELSGLLVMQIISDVYASVVALDQAYFTRALVRATGTVLAIALLKVTLTFTTPSP